MIIVFVADSSAVVTMLVFRNVFFIVCFIRISSSETKTTFYQQRRAQNQ